MKAPALVHLPLVEARTEFLMASAEPAELLQDAGTDQVYGNWLNQSEITLSDKLWFYLA